MPATETRPNSGMAWKPGNFPMCGSLVPGRCLGQASQDPHSRVRRPRSTGYPISIRETAAELSPGCGAPRQELEEDPLARRIKRLAGVAVPGCAGAALTRVRGWRTAA